MSINKGLSERIKAAASGRAPLVFKHGRIVNVYTHEIVDADIAVMDGRIIGVGAYAGDTEIDLEGRIVIPGLIDAHVHIESSQVTPRRYAEAALPRGVTAVITDPHEIANVAGGDGIRYMLDASEGILLDVYVMLPSSVPATPDEEAGAVLAADDLRPFLSHPRVLGLAEVMNVPGLLAGDPDVLSKLRMAEGRVIDGHAPGFSGNDLNAYVTAGVVTDHECQTPAEMTERLRLGQYVLMREGTAAKNVKNLMPAVTDANLSRVLLCTDDRDAHSILTEGAVDYAVRLLIKEGMDPVKAIRMASLNPATAYGLKGKGAIAPGKEATFSVLDDLDTLAVRDVYVLGQHVASAGRMLEPINVKRDVAKTLGLVRVNRPSEADLTLRLDNDYARVIGLLPESLETEDRWLQVGRSGASFMPSAELNLLMVLERYGKSGNRGMAILKGYGLAGGAIAQTIGHDSHNMLVIGDNAADMLAAIDWLTAIGGGVAICQDGRVLADLPLEIGGLMTDRSLPDVEQQSAALYEAARRDLKIPDSVDPFVALSFMSLPVIPSLKLTTKGLFDVTAFRHVGLFEKGR